MGQKTGTSNAEKKVMAKATKKAFVMAYLQPKKKKETDVNPWQ